MSEMRTSIHDLPNGGITVRCEQDLSYLVDEYAGRIQRNVDAAALDKAAGVLAGFGYVKVVRCRDCKHLDIFRPFDVYRMKPSETPEFHCTSSQFSNWDFPIEVELDGFCAWGERKVDAHAERPRGEGD